jgi:hypothetical protein
MLNDTNNTVTGNNNNKTQPSGNGDDLHLKVSVLVTNGTETFIDMNARADLPYALKKDCLLGTATNFRELITMLLLEPAFSELRRILGDRYDSMCAKDAPQRQLVTNEVHPSPNPLPKLSDFIPVTPFMAKPKKILPPNMDPDELAAALGLDRKVA